MRDLPPSNPTTGAFTYNWYGGSTVLLATQVDALGQVATYGYDARQRALQVTLPAVLPETGSATVSPVTAFRPQVLRGLDTLVGGLDLWPGSESARLLDAVGSDALGRRTADLGYRVVTPDWTRHSGGV